MFKPALKTTYAELCAIELKAQRHFLASASAWKCSNDRDRTPAVRAKASKRELSEADKGAALLAPFGIACDWPGLYPSFKVAGFTYHDARSALSAAVGQIEVQS